VAMIKSRAARMLAAMNDSAKCGAVVSMSRRHARRLPN
jgi:predicted short-subunit dehydrogenase-like oxidoreductase (DUF2520 family)